MLSNPEILHVEPQHAMVIHVTIPASQVGQAMGEEFGEVYGYLASHRAQPGMPFSLYRERPGETISFDAGAFVNDAFPETDRIKAITIPGGRVVKAVHTGPYEALAESYAQLEAWVAGASESVGEAVWEVYLTDPEAEPDASKWRTEIFWKLAEAVEGE